MVDTENLRAASLYINNQLLSRGLLRDGQSIDFANLGPGGAETAGRIIGVVNDLILRRDRDAEQRESLSTAMRSLREDNVKHTTDITRFSEKCVEAQRKLDIATSSEATLKTQLKSAESTMRGLKDELARTKALVAQARASCATEIRRRDRQIDTLKKQVGEAGRARGAKANPAVMSITVTGDIGGEEKKSLTRSGNTMAEDYSLRNETNSFLANLAQNLSEENEALLRAMQQTKDQLRDMSGWGNGEKEDAQVVRQLGWEELASELDSVMDDMRTILTNPSFVPIEEVMVREEEINRLKAGWIKMESRWEDAVRLMDGWRRRMAANGEPVADEELKMGLRLSPVRVNNVDETRAARERGLPAVEEESEEEVDLVQSLCPAPRQPMPVEEHQEEEVYEESEGEYSGYEDELPVDEKGVESNVEVEELSTAMASHIVPSAESSPLPEPPQLSPLRNSASAGNRGLQLNKVRQKPGDFTTIAEEKTQGSVEEARLAKPPLHRIKPVAQQLRSVTTANKLEERERSVSTTSLDDALLPNGRRSASEDVKSSRPEPTDPQDEPMANDSERSGGFRQFRRRMPPRLARPRNNDPDPKQNPLTMSTIAAKLAASEKEADAARVRAKLKAARSASGGVQRPVIAHAPEPKPAAEVKPSRANREDVDPVKRDPVLQEEQQKPEKRKRERRAAKTSSRRRSTLSPLELETLISGNAR